MKVVSGLVSESWRKDKVVHKVYVWLPLTSAELGKLQAASVIMGVKPAEVCRRALLVGFFGYTGTFADPTRGQVRARVRELGGGDLSVNVKSLGRFPCAACKHTAARYLNRLAKRHAQLETKHTEIMALEAKLRAAEIEIGRLRLELGRAKVDAIRAA